MTISLTPRQREIVAGICANFTYPEIARVLSRAGDHAITERTVRAHVERIAQVIAGAPELEGLHYLPPRHAVRVVFGHEQWARDMAAKLKKVA